MRTVLLSAVFCVCFSISAHADGRAFPPDHCSSDSPFMAFTGVNGSNTFCDSGQDILSNALLPNCIAGQQVTFDGSKFVCEDKPAVPTCPDSQVLTFLSGTGFACVNANAPVPTCTAGQFLTYSNNAFQCATVPTPTEPVIIQKTCVDTAGVAVNSAACTALCDPGYFLIGGGCSSDGTHNGHPSDPPYGINDGTDHYSARTYVNASEPNNTYTGWYCSVIEDYVPPSNDQTVAHGYATCIKNVSLLTSVAN